MNIGSINNMTVGRTDLYPNTVKDQTPAAEEETGVIPQNTDDTDNTTADTGKIAADDSQKVKGVIRNLQAGHFKGVADVRLRINFHDEIAAMEQAQRDSVTQAGVSEITNSVNSEIESLIQSGELDEQTAAAVAEIQAAFTSAATQAADDPIGQLKVGFDELISSLTAAVAPLPEPPAEEPAEIPAPAEGAEISALKSAIPADDEIPAIEETPSFDFDQFISQLIDTFTTKMNELETSLNNIRVLPELSQPRGKGAAYDKFLAIYNQLNGTPEANAQPEVIDAVA